MNAENTKNEVVNDNLTTDTVNDGNNNNKVTTGEISNTVDDKTDVETKKATKSRHSLTGNFNIEEMQPIRNVIDQRKSFGITLTDDHFVRQCIDFALNNNFKNNKGNSFFATPDDYKKEPLTKKGFFNK